MAERLAFDMSTGKLRALSDSHYQENVVFVNMNECSGSARFVHRQSKEWTGNAR
jgi:hypothetical protein